MSNGSEREPQTQPAAVILAEINELKKHRAVAYIGEQEIMLMLHLGSDYTVLSVHADWQRFGIAVVVAHPDLDAVPDSCTPPDLNKGVDWSAERRIIDGEIWERTSLFIAAPEVTS